MRLHIKLNGLLFALVLSAKAGVVSNTASITTNLFFYFTAGTNYLEHSKFHSGDLIRYTIASRDNKPELFRCFPAHEAFDFKLFDESGKPIPKTKLGLLWGQAGESPKTMRAVSRLHGRPAGETYDLFRADDLFFITNTGIFDLEVRMRLWAQTTNNVPNLEPWRIRGPRTNINYGLVISEPLHVRIVKE